MRRSVAVLFLVMSACDGGGSTPADSGPGGFDAAPRACVVDYTDCPAVDCNGPGLCVEGHCAYGAVGCTDASTPDGGGVELDAGPPFDGGPVPPASAHYFPPGAFFLDDVWDDSPASYSSTVIDGLRAEGGWGNGDIFQIDFSIDVLVDDGSAPRRPFEPRRAEEEFYDPDCDLSPVPIPASGNVEGEDGYDCTGGGDCHLIVYVPTANRLYEMWRASIEGSVFHGGCLAVWDTSRVYPVSGRGDQCSSADAAGFPIAPLLFTADEIAAGSIDHAIRFILPNDRVRTRRYVPPATHGTNTTGGADAPAYGVHFRLRRDYPIDSLPNEAARVVARALQRYGMYHADGGNIALTAQSDRHSTHTWEEVGLESRDLAGIDVEDFEVIDHGADVDVTYACERTQLED